MKNLIEEIQYQFEMLTRWMREQKLSLFGVSRAFYCQREIEGQSKCTNQCDHCKEYYNHGSGIKEVPNLKMKTNN